MFSTPTCFYVILIGFFGVAIPAIYRLIATRLKRDFCLLTALSAGSGKHLAWASVVVAASTIIAEPLGSSGRTTGRATLGFIGEAFGSEELLLFNRKGESFAAIGTLKGFLCESH